MTRTNFGRWIGTVAGAVWLVGITAPVNADIITLQIPGVAGDAEFSAANRLPADSIEVLSAENSVGRPAGSAAAENLSILKRFGASSPSFFLASISDRFYPTATITFFREKNQGVPAKYFTIVLYEARIQSQHWAGTSGDRKSDTERLKLSYNRIAMIDNVSGMAACWNLLTTQITQTPDC